ncbi:hypothetical protein BV20DRAFT_975361 [Pilatotrama ljubarskyi]|nr:hypothetical protein BV20DRAFT_975361 [Pilatotrama ljubarskyi]
MSRSSYAYALSYPDDCEQNIPAQDHYSQIGCYMPQLQNDVFLFSPGLCSRPSQESVSQSTSSFDTLSYICSPSDLSASATIFSPSALPSSAPSRSPTFAEAYLSGAEEKPITRLSPSTPFQRLFDSSPGGFWQADDLSVSPISRNLGCMHNFQLGSDQDADGEEDEEEAPTPGKIESLLAYEKSQEIPDSPQAIGRNSSPSSLSSLSSRSSSPAGVSVMPLPSSQTSCGRNTVCSPGKDGFMSPLGTPFKICPSSPAISADAVLTRRSTRPRPLTRSARRSLAADILNQPRRLQNSPARAASISSPLKPSSPSVASVHDSDDENYEPIPGSRRRKTRKRTRTLGRTPSDTSSKRQRTEGPAAMASKRVSSSTPPSCDSDGPIHSQRTFPLSLPIHPDFLLFYRRFPVSSVIDSDLADTHKITVPKAPDGIRNAPRDPFDLYTPRLVKGRGTSKVGLCPICHESVGRGGEGKKLWLSMKFSAFNYHMQYAHGISPATGRPFSPPLAFRVVQRANPGKLEKTQLMEGKCHKCKKWVAIEGIKDVPTKVSTASSRSAV